MKRFLCLLAVLMLFPFVSFSEETDPIVGCWYLYYNKSTTPEMESSFPGSDIVISIYQFSDSGIVYEMTTQVVNKDGTSSYSSAGKWAKNDYGYTVSIIGLGESTSYIQDDSLLLQIPNAASYYMKLKKLYPFNPYKDYVIQ